MSPETARRIAKEAAKQMGLSEEQIAELGLKMHLIMVIHTEEDEKDA